MRVVTSRVGSKVLAVGDTIQVYVDDGRVSHIEEIFD
jgi:hypothetical protein